MAFEIVILPSLFIKDLIKDKKIGTQTADEKKKHKQFINALCIEFF